MTHARLAIISSFGAPVPSRIKVSARIPSRYRTALGTWVSGSDSFGDLLMEETFNVKTHEEARDEMCRLIVGVGASIKSIETERIYS